MPDHKKLWQQAETIKSRVRDTIGEKPPREFRATFAYQNYTAACGEVFWAGKTGELDENLLRLLQEAAGKVIETWKNQKG